MNLQSEQLNKINRIVLGQTIFIGWIGGILFSIFLFILFYFQLIDTNISTFIKEKANLFDHWYGKIVLLLLLSILSIIVTLFYYIIAKKMSKWFVGVIFGIMMWVVFCTLFYVFSQQNFTFNIRIIHESINLLCLFILYGLFIGYSISFAYQLQLTELHIKHNKYKSSSDYDKI